MDTSDRDIVFDDAGRCNHCIGYEEFLRTRPSDEERARTLDRRLEVIRRAGRNRRYDCLIGLSGGVDSSYVALKVKALGLRALAVHLDNGWNSETATSNIQKLVESLGIDLYTNVLDWNEFRGLQVAFLEASVPDGEIPTDHAIVSTVFSVAQRENIGALILGYNTAAELILPPAWSEGHFDWRYIKAINQRFGSGSLKSYPHMDFAGYVRFRYWNTKRALNILDFGNYDRDAAIAELESVGWRYYGGKHYESIYTRFFQGYVLPVKFGIDKRRAHLSSLIMAGLETRASALEKLAMPPYPSDDLLRSDREFVLKKLGLTEPEFERIMALPHKRRADYPNMLNSRFFLASRGIYRAVRRALP